MSERGPPAIRRRPAARWRLLCTALPPPAPCRLLRPGASAALFPRASLHIRTKCCACASSTLPSSHRCERVPDLLVACRCCPCTRPRFLQICAHHDTTTKELRFLLNGKYDGDDDGADQAMPHQVRQRSSSSAPAPTELRAIISTGSSTEINPEAATLGLATGRQQGRDLRSCSRAQCLQMHAAAMIQKTAARRRTTCADAQAQQR